MQRTVTILLLSGTLLGCDLSSAPILEYENRRPMRPPPEYIEWYRAVEGCRGMLGHVERITWYVADRVLRDGEPAGAAIDFPNEITMQANHVFYWPAVRHEMDHHLMQVGDELHLPGGGTACDGLMGPGRP